MNTSGKKSSGAKQLGVNAICTVATRLLQIVVLIWVNRYLLKRIDTEEYSLFPLITSLIFFVQFVSTVTTGGIARYLVVADSQNDERGLTRITTSMMPVLIGTAILLMIAGGIVVWRLPDLIVVAPQYLWQARIMLVMILSYLCYNIVATPFSSGMYVRQRFAKLSLVQLICEAVRTALLIALLLGVSPRVVWLVVGSLFAEVLNTTLRIRFTVKHIPAIRVQRSSFCASTAKQLTSFGAWTSVTGFNDLVSKTVPILLLNRYATAIDVAAFHLGRLPDLQLRKIISSAMIPFQPAITRVYAQQGDAAMSDIFYRGNRYALWISLFLLAPLIVFSDHMFTLYVGKDYWQAAAVMSLMLARYPFLFAITMFYRVSHATAKIRSYYLSEIVIQVATLGSMFVAVVYQASGAVGIAIAMSVTEGMLNFLMVWKLSLVNIRGRWSHFLKLSVMPGCAPFVTAVLVCLAFRAWLPLDNWSALVVASTCATIAYLVIMLAICLDRLDRELFSDLVQSVQVKGSRLVNRFFHRSVETSLTVAPVIVSQSNNTTNHNTTEDEKLVSHS